MQQPRTDDARSAPPGRGKYDEDGDCIRDMEPIEWIEVCAYPTEDGETLKLDPRSDSTIRDMLDEAAAKAGYGIRWGTYSETTTWEYHEVEVY